jgi:hypothetical protein
VAVQYAQAIDGSEALLAIRASEARRAMSAPDTDGLSLTVGGSDLEPGAETSLLVPLMLLVGCACGC